MSVGKERGGYGVVKGGGTEQETVVQSEWEEEYVVRSCENSRTLIS